MNRSDIIKNAKRIVVKIGTGTITGSSGRIDNTKIENIANDISSVINKGKEVLLVTSGAIASGTEKLKLKSKQASLPLKQAAAAVGQNLLMHIYEEVFSKHGFSIAQILLTQDDFRNRARFINARNTIYTLLKYRVIPIINENDTVSVEEIKFGDNDNLSFLVSNLVEADLLIILSDVDGLHTADPRKHEGKLITEVKHITDEIESVSCSSTSKFGIGGMQTKISAAKRAVRLGIGVIIANGTRKNILTDIINCKETGTFFFPQKTDKIKQKKKWIAFTLVSKGKIFIDEGAKEAITKKGKSLLSSGIVGVEGEFEFGDAISIYDKDMREIARGLVNYNSSDIEKIKGKKSLEIESILGYKDYDEVIHRDNLVIIKEGDN